MSEKDSDSRLDALVGAALRGLVEAGASANAIGAFAASYRAEAASILGLKDHKPEAPDIDEVVVSAVERVLSEAGIIRGAKPRQRATAKSVRFIVTVAGKRTSVSITSNEAQQLIQEKGSRASATEFIQTLVNRAPPDVENRSLWVRERLIAEQPQPPGVLHH